MKKLLFLILTCAALSSCGKEDVAQSVEPGVYACPNVENGYVNVYYEHGILHFAFFQENRFEEVVSIPKNWKMRKTEKNLSQSEFYYLNGGK